MRTHPTEVNFATDTAGVEAPTAEFGWTRPAPTRLADLKRTGAWPFLTWCFAAGQRPRRPLPGMDIASP